MGIGKAINSTATGAANMAEAWPAVPVAVSGVGGGFLGRKLSERFDSPEDYEDMTPEEILAAIRRRRRLWTAAGAVAGAAVPTYFMGDFSGYSEGPGEGTRRFLSRLLVPGANSSPEAREDRRKEYEKGQTPKGGLYPMSVPIPDAKQAVAGLEKMAQAYTPGMFGAPIIPLGGTMNMVAADPWLHPEQKAGLMNLLASAAHTADSPMFSGYDLARTAVQAGVGAAGGWALGRLMGTVSLLPNSTVRTLSNSGAVAGALLNTGVIGF